MVPESGGLKKGVPGSHEEEDPEDEDGHGSMGIFLEGEDEDRRRVLRSEDARSVRIRIEDLLRLLRVFFMKFD